ncbi:MAG TPA: metallophosphoesterase family protein [Anaeromyxobacteraceae bacterium]
MRVGLVSDTHGLLEPRLAELFRGCDLILHAGDVVAAPVLEALSRLAPVTAVRGNNDRAPAFAHLPELAEVALGDVRAILVHQIGSRGRLLRSVREAVARTGARLLVYGHSHRPVAVVEDGLLRVNPGAAGPRRFRLPRSAGLLELDGRRIAVRIFDLDRPDLPLLQPPLEVEV